MSVALDFTYRYPFSSGFAAGNDDSGKLSLATCTQTHEHPYFFDGLLRQPRLTGDMLLALSNVVRTHYFLPRPPQMDPVLTGSESMLRLEGFSGCCGVYARVDLDEQAFDGEILRRGTTNVDFNNPMRAALTRMRDTEDVRFAVGADEFVLKRQGEATVEKKVRLPIRWIKGFSEVQVYQSTLELKAEITGAEALRFIRGLPKSGAPKTPSWIVSAGRGLRLSQREKKDAVRLQGIHRLRELEAILPRAKQLRLWADDATGVSGWEAVYEQGRFLMIVSPELYRGFSGEGQLLETLANEKAQKLLTQVRARLKWENTINAADIAAQLDATTDDVHAALAVLGARGLVGFDIASGSFFHRELPFDLSKVEDLQPRLLNARKLLDAGHVGIADRHADGGVDVNVQSKDVTHFVRLRDDGDKCSCPWFSKHMGERGPCKHILAANMFVDAKEEAGDDAGRSSQAGS